MYIDCNISCSKDYFGTNIKELAFGNSVTSIGGDAFSSCSALEKLTIGSGVREIKDDAFAGAGNILEIYSLPVIPPTCSSENVFDQYVYKAAVVYVPQERNAEARYKAEEVWNKFFDIYAKDLAYLSADNYDVTLSPAGYATFYSSECAYALPEGLSAQVVDYFNDNKLSYSTIADGSLSGIIPKGTAVMLVGDVKCEGTFTLTPAESTEDYIGDNYLHGSDKATITTASGANYFYKLTYGEGEQSNAFGWYWGAKDGAAFRAEAHEAWLALPKSSVTCSVFILDGGDTGIEDITNKTSNEGAYYDLQGRRTGTPKTSGIYIVNGKKMLIK